MPRMHMRGQWVLRFVVTMAVYNGPQDTFDNHA
jgi:hypothetical protein